VVNTDVLIMNTERCKTVTLSARSCPEVETRAYLMSIR